jgi:hypothetical protein
MKDLLGPKTLVLMCMTLCNFSFVKVLMYYVFDILSLFPSISFMYRLVFILHNMDYQMHILV